MSDHDYSSFCSPGSDLNRDGRVDFAEYDNDCHDFNASLGKGPRGRSTPPAGSGWLHRIKWMSGSDLLLLGLISLMCPPLLIVAVIVVIIGLVLNA